MNRPKVSPPPTPFKGLAPFEDSALDASFFFGREREIEVIVANLMANRLTVLYGPSGVGKTSLLRAGLAQRLRQETDALVVVASSWAGDPVADLLDATDNALPASVEVRRTGSLPDGLGSLVRRLDTNVYLVLDQFEEYFLYHEGESGSGTLMEDLPEALRRRGLRANFLLGIREDSLAQLDAFKGRIPNLFANTLRLDRLDRRAGEAAIVGPIGEYNRLSPGEPQVEIEPELVDALLHDVAVGRVDLGRSGRGGVEDEADAGRIEAPYLQLVLQRLWEVEASRGSRRLRVDTLRELGGAARVVQDHLERAMSELSPSQRDAAAAMYNHLVTPSGTKIAHRVGDLAGYAGVDEAAAGGVLSRLVDQRIVRAGGDGVGGPRYEIFHDVLADAVLAWRTRHEADSRLEAEREAAEERHRRIRMFAVAASVAVAILAAISIYALTLRGTARSEARHARAREFAALASAQLPDDPEESLRLALEANRIEQSLNSETVLRSALRALRVQAILPGGGDASVSRDGTLVLTVGVFKARLFRADTGKPVRSFPHGAPLETASISPDGSVVVTAGRNGIARMWNAQTGARLWAVKHGRAVTSAIFSPDGTLLATTSADGTARILDVATGDQVKLLKPKPGQPVKSASFSGDGRLLVTVLENDRVAPVFDVRSGRRISRLTHPDRVTSAHFGPRRDLVVTGCEDGVARVWHARTRNPPVEFRGHRDPILDAEFNHSGDQIVTASTDQTGRVWDAKTGISLALLSNHKNRILHAHFSADDATVVTASADGRATVFKANGTILTTLIGHDEAVRNAVFNHDGTAVLTASDDGTARLWDPLPDPSLTPLGAGKHQGKVTAVAISPDNEFVASAGEDGDVRIVRLGGGALVKRFAIGAPATHVVFSSDSALLLASSATVTVRVWRTSDWIRAGTLRHRFPVVAADLSPDGRFAATADEEGTVRVWDVATSHTRWIRGGRGTIAAVAFSPDSSMLVTAGADQVARLRRVDDGEFLEELAGHKDAIVTASFSPDGHRLVTASTDKTAIIWDTATGDLEHVLSGHHQRLTSASFSPDSRLVVTTSSDNDSRVWLAESATQLFEPLIQATDVYGASFSADSRWLVTASQTAGVWGMSNGDNLFLLRQGAASPTAVAFAPTGWRIVTGGSDGGVRTYDCELCVGVRQLVALARARLARLHP